MSSLPAAASLRDVSEIVKTDDPEIIAMVQRIMDMDTDALLELGGAAKAFLDDETQRFEERVAHDKMLVRVVEAVALKRILAAGGTALPHDRYDVHIERSKSISKDIATLRQLEGKVPDEELAPALYLDQPEPQWKADGTKLNALVRKYGEDSEIGQIIKRACAPVYGAPKLVFRERQGVLKSVGGA